MAVLYRKQILYKIREWIVKFFLESNSVGDFKYSYRYVRKLLDLF